MGESPSGRGGGGGGRGRTLRRPATGRDRRTGSHRGRHVRRRRCSPTLASVRTRKAGVGKGREVDAGRSSLVSTRLRGQRSCGELKNMICRVWSRTNRDLRRVGYFHTRISSRVTRKSVIENCGFGPNCLFCENVRKSPQAKRALSTSISTSIFSRRDTGSGRRREATGAARPRPPSHAASQCRCTRPWSRDGRVTRCARASV